MTKPTNKQLRRKSKERFSIASKIEKEYLRFLRLLITQIKTMVNTTAPGQIAENPDELTKMLTGYAKTIEPWARNIAEKVIKKIFQKDENTWAKLGHEMGTLLRKEINEAPTGDIFKKFIDEQITLITNIPIDVAQEVTRISREQLKLAQEITTEAKITGARSTSLIKQIQGIGAFTENRAKLIARTEVARTASSLTIARGQHVGATHYIWRATPDADTRASHKAMNGKIIAFNDPPEVEPGHRYHAGQFPNCFPGSSNINGFSAIEKFYRRRYTGKLSSLVFDDIVLTATPNHPILGINGMQSINNFSIGDYVIGEKYDAFRAIDNNIQSFNISFEQIFNAAYMSPVFTCSTCKSGEFHGDRTNEEVDIVSINTGLVVEINRRTQQKLMELGFTDSDATLMYDFLIGSCSQTQFIKRAEATCASDMSRLKLIVSLLLVHLTPLDFFCFALTPYVNFSLNKPLPNSATVNTESFSNLIFAYAIFVHGNDIIRIKLDSIMGGFVFPDSCIYPPSTQMLADQSRIDFNDFRNINQSASDRYKFRRVIDKIDVDFSGHVYNLQTINGYYTTQSCLVSNCRCWPQILIPED